MAILTDPKQDAKRQQTLPTKLVLQLITVYLACPLALAAPAEHDPKKLRVDRWGRLDDRAP